MTPEDDGFLYASDWVYWWGTIQSSIAVFIIAIYVIFNYSHVPKCKFGYNVSAINVTFAFITLVVRLFTIWIPELCALHLLETCYFTCEFNLFHYRTAIFYQSSKKLYGRLFHMMVAMNCLMAYHNFIALCLFNRIPPAQYGCAVIIGLKTYTVMVPVYGIKCYMLIFGFYTVSIYWRASSESDRKRIRILWLVVFTYSWEFFASLVALAQANTVAMALLLQGIEIFSKILSLVLAIAIHIRVRERYSSKSDKTPSWEHTTNDKPTKPSGRSSLVKVVSP